MAVARGGGEVKAPGDRRRGGAARLPRHVLQPAPRRPGAAQDGRDRLRHLDRAGPARRAAHRQDQGGGHPPPRRPPGLRRRRGRRTARPAGSPASSTSPPRWRSWPSSGPIKTQSDGVMAVLRSPQTAVHLVTLLEDMPVQETADAIEELTKAGLPVGSVDRQHGHRAGAAGRRACRGPPSGRLTGAELLPALAAAHLPGARGARRRAGRRGHRARRALGRRRTRCGTTSRRSAGRRSSCRCSPGRWTSAALFELADRLEDHLRDRGRRVSAARGAVRRPAATARPRPRRRRWTSATLLTDRDDPDHRLLRLRRRGQDDDVGGARAGRGRGRPDGRRPHHRPGPAAGAVPRPGGAGQRAAAGGRPRGRRRTARDDAGHEADVRRHRRRALHARTGRGDPREPLLPVAVVLVLRARRSTWRWRSWASCGPPTSGT